MFHRILSLLLPLAFVAPAIAAEEVPDPKDILERMIAAAEGEAFAKLGILELEVSEQETRNDGTQSVSSYTVLIDTANLNNMRMELPGEVVVAKNQGGGWSTIANVLDDRPQTPVLAKRSINQAVFPLLLPHSLQMDGVWLKEVREATVEGRDVWVVSLPFSKSFFVNPVMETTWILVVAKDDYSIVSLEFAPSAQFRDVSPVGVRYRILKQKELEGAKVVEQILAIGINWQYQESGANRVTRISPKVRPWDATLFLSPAQLEALEEEED
jgi:hypothetical protein